MLRWLALSLLAACSGSQATHVDAPASDAPPPDAPVADAPAGRLLRLLDGNAAIRPDGSAFEDGVTYPTVTDGMPQLPALVSDPSLGRVLAFTVPTDTSGHKQRIEYKLAQAVDPDGLHFDNARYAGFAFQIPATSQPFLGTAIFWQAWQGYPYGPPISLKIATSSASPYRVKLAIRNASVGPHSSVPDIEVWSGTLDVGTWHTFLVYASPRFDHIVVATSYAQAAHVLGWQ